MPIYPYEKKDGSTWYYYSFEGKDKDGKRKTFKKQGYKTQAAAKSAERTAKEAVTKGSYIAPSKFSYREYATVWFDNKQNLSDQSRYTNEGQLKHHIYPELGNLNLSKITATHMETFVKTLQNKVLKNGKKLSEGTVKKIFNFVQTSLNAAVKKELITRNPCDLMDTKPTVGKAKMDYWSKEEVKKFLGSFDHRLKLLFILAIRTGMRRGELLGIRMKDIDFDNAKITVNQILGFKGKIKAGAKTASGNRSVSVTPTVLEAVRKHRLMVMAEKLAAGEKYEDNGLLFCSELGKSISWGNFHKFWARTIIKSGCRYIKFHDLRHTCATILLSTPGVHPKVVQELLGHSSIKITLDTYSSVLPNMQSDAVLLMEEMLN